jgi:hypothetical protein
MKVVMWRQASIASLLIVGAAGPAAIAQGCNPAVDGTYCASAGVRSAPDSSSPFNTPPRFSLAPAMGPGFADQPATLGAITFGNDGSRCLGLIRRERCAN